MRHLALPLPIILVDAVGQMTRVARKKMSPSGSNGVSSLFIEDQPTAASAVDGLLMPRLETRT
jgi:hypothetical protein